MRADIHGGPEQKLQSEAGYIDARPQTDSSTKTSCIARPDHTSGSRTENKRCLCRVRHLISGHVSAGWHVSIVFGRFAILANTLKVQTPDTRKSERLPS